MQWHHFVLWQGPAGTVHDHFVWSEEDELGRGSFGRVFRGKSCYDSKKAVAIKQMARSSIEDVDQLWSEINILSDLDHPNILRFLEAYEDRCSFYIATQLRLVLWVGKYTRCTGRKESVLLTSSNLLLNSFQFHVCAQHKFLPN